MSSVEVITSVQRRRCWSLGEKKAVVEEAEQPGMSILTVDNEIGLAPEPAFTAINVWPPPASICSGGWKIRSASFRDTGTSAKNLRVGEFKD